MVYLGGVNEAGGKMKEIGTIEQGSGLWHSPNTYASNSSGFTGLPGGYRNNMYNFAALGYQGNFWSSSEAGNFDGDMVQLNYNAAVATMAVSYKQNGYTVRCLKD